MAIGFLIGAGVLYTSLSLYYAAEQQHADYRYQPAREARRVAPAASTTQPSGYEPACQNPQGNADADLCAQWAAVDQVTESNRLNAINLRIALLTALLTTAGTVFIAWTFLDSRDSSRRELRAYVRIDVAGAPAYEQLAANHVRFSSENYGETPAHSLKLAAAHFFGPIPLPEDHSLAGLEWQDCGGGVVLHPGDKPDFAKNILMSPAEVAQASTYSDECQLYVVARVTYRDVFDLRHVEQVCACIRYDEKAAAGGRPRVQTANRHNEST